MLYQKRPQKNLRNLPAFPRHSFSNPFFNPLKLRLTCICKGLGGP